MFFSNDINLVLVQMLSYLSIFLYESNQNTNTVEQ